jgi:hypothetical protein
VRDIDGQLRFRVVRRGLRIAAAVCGAFVVAEIVLLLAVQVIKAAPVFVRPAMVVPFTRVGWHALPKGPPKQAMADDFLRRVLRTGQERSVLLDQLGRPSVSVSALSTSAPVSEFGAGERMGASDAWTGAPLTSSQRDLAGAMSPHPGDVVDWWELSKRSAPDAWTLSVYSRNGHVLGASLSTPF